MNKSTNETGASMVEILGVLAVVATIAVGMFTGISRMNQKIKLTQAQTEVTDIVKAMRTQFSSFTPSSITSKGLYDVGILKMSMTKANPPTYTGQKCLWSLNPTWKILILHSSTKIFPPVSARICCWVIGGTILLRA